MNRLLPLSTTFVAVLWRNAASFSGCVSAVPFTDLKILTAQPLSQITGREDAAHAALMAVYVFAILAALQKLFLNDDSSLLIDQTWNENCRFHYFPQQTQISLVSSPYKAKTTLPSLASIKHLFCCSRLFLRTLLQVKRSRLPKAPAEVIEYPPQTTETAWKPPVNSQSPAVLSSMELWISPKMKSVSVSVYFACYFASTELAGRKGRNREDRDKGNHCVHPKMMKRRRWCTLLCLSPWIKLTDGKTIKYLYNQVFVLFK